MARSDGAARGEAATRRQLPRGTGPSDRAQPLPGAPPGNRSEQAPRCRDASRREEIATTADSSTMRPAYITATRSAISATTPRSCVMSSSARPSSRFSSRSSSRICAWIVTSSAVVGSSAISSGRPAGERHRDHARADGYRRRAGADSRRRACRGRESHGSSSSIAFSPARGRSTMHDQRLTIWSPMVKTGLSAVIGS